MNSSADETAGELERLRARVAELERQLAEHEQLKQRFEERTRELRTANRILREDVNRREELTKEVRASEETCRLVVESMPIPVSIARMSDGRILYANPLLAERFGIPHEQLAGHTTLEFYANPADRRKILELLERDGRVEDYQVKAKSADGATAWLSLSIEPITYQGERCLLAGAIDISERVTALENSRKERQLLQSLLNLHERDRQLTAFEIHDGMVQDMTGSLMFLQSIRDQVAAANRSAGDVMDKAIGLVQSSIDEARRLINGLRPPVLEDDGIVAAIDNLIDEITAVSGLTVDFEHDIRFDHLAPALETAIYRVVQESLNNVWKHSKAPRAEVKLLQQNDAITIIIADAGVGFDPKAVSQSRYGLKGIRERSRLLDGKAKITSAPGQGTQVRVELPVTELRIEG